MYHPRLLWLLLLVPVLIFVGCEGDRGPAGPAGPPGPTGSVYTYVGDHGDACRHCHLTTLAQVALTGHTHAYDNLAEPTRENPYCLQCHTTGWDSELNEAGDAIETPGDDVNGYDDYWGVTGDEAVTRRSALEGVQCESCHGPSGPDFNNHTPNMSFATRSEGGESLSLCSPCHDGQLEEWVTSPHAMPAGGDHSLFKLEHYATASYCIGCHTSEGFILANDPAYAGYEFQGDPSFIGCVTCHDPHAGDAGGGNEAQLRAVGPVDVAYTHPYNTGDAEVPTMEGYGAAQTCAQCHHARRTTENVDDQIAEGDEHFGPHSSPQMDMFIGAGCYEIDTYTYDGVHSHQSQVANACVKCHMVREVEMHGSLQDHSFHTFSPDVGNCEPCHVGLTDLNYENVQTIVQTKLDQLAVLFGYADAATMLDHDTGWDSEAGGVTSWQREAAYALYFVNADGSLGVHNPDYTIDLLDNAIAHYQDSMPAPLRVN